MRLINVNNLQLEVHYPPNLPPYAILSHTWGKDDEEVTLQQWPTAFKQHDAACPHCDKCRADWAEKSRAIQRKPGYIKIVQACHHAKTDGLTYLWVDTNCIDKTNSAELSESITSMYQWYQESEVCYAYLADVTAPAGAGQNPGTQGGWFTQHEGDSGRYTGNDTWLQFEKSRWWTRGWTLQELIAPDKVKFVSQDWTWLGDKDSLADWISGFTAIHKTALVDRDTVPSFSIAQRMSWAASRQTSRIEDIAYCLLGIFNISMGAIYGEGEDAFQRLQREIVKISEDHSILAWESVDQEHVHTTAFAPEPFAFRNCGSIVRDNQIVRWPYSITNLGVYIRIPLILTSANNILLAGLNCSSDVSPGYSVARRQHQIWVPLRGIGNNRYTRSHVPLSTILLANAYVSAEIYEVREIYITTDSRDIPKGVPSPARLAIRTHTGCSGFLVQVGSGDIKPSRLFSKTCRLPNFYMATLRPRNPSSVSHQLIASGNFSTLLSAAWDKMGCIESYCHITFRDAKLRNIHTMSQSLEFKALFQDEHPRSSAESSNPTAHLLEIHDRIRKAYGEAQEDLAPSIIDDGKNEAGQMALMDLHSKPTIAILVVFREPLMPM
ncbi:heterokaryon incompatibility protein-domain-containing protein [Xylariales sp. AK1849]|nr:heterokaryon incompatibility protein-domain-containing protein [Xylariales sp. AK1849]